MARDGIRVADLADAIGGELVGNGELVIDRPNEPSLAGKDDIAIAADAKFVEELKTSAARVAVIPPDVDWTKLGLDAAIIVKSARRMMVDMARALEIPWSLHWSDEKIHPSAIVHPSAKIAPSALIGPFAVIAENVEIGDDTVIFDHVTIAQDVQIGSKCQIYSGVRIGPGVQIGNEVVVQANSVIGGDGFSYLTPNQEAIRSARDSGSARELSDLQIERINSLGSVVLGDRVEIGTCTCIDRGTLKNTVIGAGTKIDNQVQIGHNAQIGQNCLICGQSGVAGSAVIGDRTIVGGATAISDNIKVGEDVIVAGMTGVNTNVPSKQVVMGNPAFKMESNIESYKLYRRLPRLAARIKAIEEQLSGEEPKT